MLRNVATDHQVVGKVGRLSSGIEAGGMGEVVFSIRGGTETYFAYATTPDESIPKGVGGVFFPTGGGPETSFASPTPPDESIPKGARVIVLEHEPPRTVVVSSF